MSYCRERETTYCVAGVIAGKAWRHTSASVEATTSLKSVSDLFLSLPRDSCFATAAVVLHHHCSGVAVALIAGKPFAATASRRKRSQSPEQDWGGVISVLGFGHMVILLVLSFLVCS